MTRNLTRNLTKSSVSQDLVIIKQGIPALPKTDATARFDKQELAEQRSPVAALRRAITLSNQF